MNRLTARTDNGTAYITSETGEEGVGHFTTLRRLPELISRLAAYEDTGFSPEEINQLQADLEEAKPCACCKHQYTDDCVLEEMMYACGEFIKGSKWEWRGVAKEERA